jgi:DtxR family Mn-dependent transcriptional regulator
LSGERFAAEENCGKPSERHCRAGRPTQLPKTLTLSIQDYIKLIYDLTSSGEPASTTALAGRLGISPASVTGMVQKLARVRPPLVLYRKHHGVLLTAAGKRAALEVIRHHRLLETWLVQSLGYSWDRVHGEAENLEHAISEEMVQRISAALGDPKRDPHGDPIPTADLRLPPDRSIALADLTAGQEAVIKRVRSDNASVLRNLAALGLVINAHVRAIQEPGDDLERRLQVGARKQLVSIDPMITGSVYVEPIRKKRRS